MAIRGKLAHRPPRDQNLASMCREYTDLAVEKLVSIVKNGKSEMSQIAAASILLDRGWGKAKQVTTHEEGPITVEIVYRQREPKLIEGTIVNGHDQPPSTRG